jgi:hypothetical protein
MPLDPRRARFNNPNYEELISTNERKRALDCRT